MTSRATISAARAELGEERPHHALLLLHEGEQEVLGLERLVIPLVGQRLGYLHRFLRLHRQLVEPHRYVLSGRRAFSSASNSFSRLVSPAGMLTWTRTYWSPAFPPLRCGIP